MCIRDRSIIIHKCLPIFLIAILQFHHNVLKVISIQMIQNIPGYIFFIVYNSIDFCDNLKNDVNVPYILIDSCLLYTSRCV